MAIILTDAQKEIIRKIIYAVETGGQIYGKMDYEDFTEAYTNSPNEHAITIGAGAWYANEAKNLLIHIRSANVTAFNKLDTEGISDDLNTKDWSVYKLSITSQKAKCIQKIISSEIGKKCQDNLIDKQIEKYINESANLGVTDIDALMMCSNFRHQGGLSAVKRILQKTKKPYTLDHLYSACSTDTGNQVGAYKGRQKMVYNALKKYVPATLSNSGGVVMTMTQAIEKVIAIAKAEVGYLEKKSNANLDDKTANAGSNNYTKYWRDIANWGLGNYNAQYWCAAFIFWCFVKTFGQDKAKKLLLHAPYISCATGANLFNKAGRLYSEPKVGDVVIFKKSNGVFGHTGLVYKVANEYFYTIEGNTSSTAGVIANGGAVAYKSYSISEAKSSGHKFARPDYSLVGSIVDNNITNTNTTISGSGISLNKKAKWNGIVTADSLNVRTGAGKNNKTCSFSPLTKGTHISVCDSVKADNGDIWYYILFNAKYGFVHSDYVKKEDVSTATKTDNDSVKKKVTAIGEITEKKDKTLSGIYQTTADLNMRNDVGKNAKSLVIIPKGTKVANYGYYKTFDGVKWYYIQVTMNNIVYTGFSSSKYLKKV